MMTDNSFGLYIHIPFCRTKCPYCDFNTYADSKPPESLYFNALINELDRWSEHDYWKNRKIKSIYAGGGTPSLMSTSSWSRLLMSVFNNFSIDPDAEITIEANPSDLTKDRCVELLEIGFNRISIGVQSFSDKILGILGRSHSSETAFKAVRNAKEAGFKNINMDLIYAVPEQSMEELCADLSQALCLDIPHISAYSLTIEKGTEFFRRYKWKNLLAQLTDTGADMMKQIMTVLCAKGYKHYEISNFSRAGFESSHNKGYWKGRDYLGIGAGAHSMKNISPSARLRWGNFALPDEYIGRANNGRDMIAWQEEVTEESLIFEFFFLGLRLRQGVSISDFEKTFGLSIFQLYDGVIDLLVHRGLLEINGDHLRLTDRGILLADGVISSFLLDSSTPIIRTQHLT